MANQTTARIAELNDAFRTSGTGGTILITRGIAALGETIAGKIARAVKTFDDFTEGDNPYGEWDFGAFEVEGHKLFWKIDYYAPDMMHGSENPSDPDITRRVLTIMLRDEY